ncbi:HAUS augmin like complex subunit 2 [Homo sapiens]|uniref:HAUS augmin like complex subunit 2 n=1 Tax=Homo sapiens TaxID=9606 RepID=J3QT48_HUMAN|nr:HAUS augmin like complex subunit 2 [Homo sapiens]KAI2573799.1 HAUS augmin like complex subunit 2 [Homo sapiens]KAI4057399.1 HAUS augmin like complex subunit 2 [Homo sapiens]KAI4057401.1 HAUS augmin like complex subunit 2 [Homo sapiens]
MAAANPWDPASAPNGAGLVLGHFIASGMVNQKNLEIELLKLEKDTADVVHPFFLEMKSCYVAQAGLELMASILPFQSPKTLRLQLRSVILCKA